MTGYYYAYALYTLRLFNMVGRITQRLKVQTASEIHCTTNFFREMTRNDLIGQLNIIEGIRRYGVDRETDGRILSLQRLVQWWRLFRLRQRRVPRKSVGSGVNSLTQSLSLTIFRAVVCTLS